MSDEVNLENLDQLPDAADDQYTYNQAKVNVHE